MHISEKYGPPKNGKYIRNQEMDLEINNFSSVSEPLLPSVKILIQLKLFKFYR